MIIKSLRTHLSPLSWDRINLTGDYVWHASIIGKG
jgi:hypothetical protein